MTVFRGEGGEAGRSHLLREWEHDNNVLVLRMQRRTLRCLAKI